MPTLEEFLKTGTLGPIRSGMTYAEVVAALGPPQAESVKRKPRVLKYGPLQLALTRGADEVERVSLTSLYTRESVDQLPPPARLSDAIPHGEGEFRSFLSGVVPSVTQADDGAIRLPSGVRVVFADGAVHSLHVAPLKPKTKQLNVSLPTETLAALQALAKANKKESVAELASALLQSQADATKKGSPAPTP